MIDTLISGLYTPVERAAAGFAVDWGLHVRGFTTHAIYQSRRPACDALGLAPHRSGWTEMLHSNICDADLVLVLCSTQQPTSFERNVEFSSGLAGVACLRIDPDLDWQEPLHQALRDPKLRRLYVTGGTPSTDPDPDDPRVAPLLAAVFEALDPRDPQATFISDDELARRLDALRRRFPYQFQHLPGAMLTPERGWVGLVEQLCADIDTVLPEVRKPHFYWTQIKEKFGGLRAYWSLGPQFVDAMDRSGVAAYRFPQRPGTQEAPWQPVDDLINAAMVASRNCCGDCGAPGQLRRRWWSRTLCDLHARPGWTPRKEGSA